MGIVVCDRDYNIEKESSILIQVRSLIPLVVKVRSAAESEASGTGFPRFRYGIADSLIGEQSHRITKTFPLVNIYHEPRLFVFATSTEGNLRFL